MSVWKTVAAFFALAIFLLMIFGRLLARAPSVKAYSETIYVDVANFDDPDEDGSLEHPFDMIQEGVDAASQDDIIWVAPGVYREYVQIAKSSISLVGAKGTIIDGDGVRYGIRVGAVPGVYAEHVSISGFVVQNCVKGVVFVRCRFTCFRNVSMVGNLYNFADYSLHVNDIDISNTVDGRPIYYWVNKHDLQVPADAGYVALVNCTNIVVKNLNLTRNGQGAVLKYTSGSVIEYVNVSDNYDGVYMDAGSRDNTIKECTVTNNLFMGIYLSNSWSNTISNNKISRNKYGVFLDKAGNANMIVNNSITENDKGLYFYGESDNATSGNVVRANTVSNNSVGISLLFSRNNMVYHNNFVDNSDQAYTFYSTDRWDDNGEGNHWSDYAGEDMNSDGFGDTPYLIDQNNRDNYPLMGSLSFFSVAWEKETYYLSVISNSTISKFCFMQQNKLVSLNVTGSDVTSGFCKVSIPIILLGGPYTILVDQSPPKSLVQVSNGAYTFFYLTYETGNRSIEIKGTTAIPEFPSFLLGFFLVTLLVTFCYIGQEILIRAKAKVEIC